MTTAPPIHIVEAAVDLALAEDIGLAGDLTTAALVSPEAVGRAVLATREDGVLAGTWTTDAICGRFDLMASWAFDDGDEIAAGDVVAELDGSLADMLTAERTILNFLGHLSGIATATRRFVDLAGGSAIRDTRKTTPGLRALEKAAVRCGGGVGQRMGLFDAVLIKDNHIAAWGGDTAGAVRRARQVWPTTHICCEAETVEAAVEAAATGADLVLLDNMTPGQAVDAVAALGDTPAEISGRVRLDNIAEYAKAGAAYISIGAITASAATLDLGLDLVEAGVAENYMES